MLPVDLVCVLALHPVLELALFIVGALLGEVFLELGLVCGPLLFKAGGGLLDVALNRLGLNLGQRGPLNEESLLVAHCLGHPDLHLVPSY